VSQIEKFGFLATFPEMASEAGNDDILPPSGPQREQREEGPAAKLTLE